MFNSQCSILIRTEGGRTTPSDSQSDIRFLMAAPYYLMFRAIALTLRAGLHSRPLIFG